MSEWNDGGYLSNDSSLSVENASCAKMNQVPSLDPDWQKHKNSRGFALETAPNDHWQLAYLQTLSQRNPPKMLGTGYLLGIACAEYYSQDHYGQESLWYMDWRARLIPCEYDQSQNLDDVIACGGSYPPSAAQIRTQFQRETMLDLQKNWKF
jgi:hypothetical protein